IPATTCCTATAATTNCTAAATATTCSTPAPATTPAPAVRGTTPTPNADRFANKETTMRVIRKLAAIQTVILLASALAAPGLTRTSASGPTCDGKPAFQIPGNGTTWIGTYGADVVLGTPGDDVIYGGLAGDTICGGGGNDQIFGQGGGDRLFGDEGND